VAKSATLGRFSNSQLRKSSSAASHSQTYVPVTWVTVYTEPIGNTFGAERILDRLHPSHLVVEVAQIVAHEGREPDVVAAGYRLRAQPQTFRSPWLAVRENSCAR